MLFVGTPGGLEAALVPQAEVPFTALPARGFDRSAPLSLPIALGVLAASTVRARRLVRSWGPDVVVGFGGYASIPVGLAAAATRTPLVLHEQNSVPGLANRLLSRFAAAVGVTYPGSVPFLARPERASVTGNPVRESVLAARREEARRSLGYTNDDLVLLVFGGSRGARHLNDAMLDLYERLMVEPRLRVMHAAGRIGAASVREKLAQRGGDPERYRVLDYIDDMGSALSAADLVIARAGATSIAEVTASGKPAVLVPYPYATDDHQTLNARAVAAAGAGVAVADADLDSPLFAETVERLLADGGERRRMADASAALGRPRAAEAVAEMARAAAGRTRRRSRAEGE